MTTTPRYQAETLAGFAAPVEARFEAGAWAGYINPPAHGGAYYLVRALAAPTHVGGQEVVAEQVSVGDSGRETRVGYIGAATWGRLQAALAALGAPRLDLEATRRDLVDAVLIPVDRAEQDRHDAIAAAVETGRMHLADDRAGEIAAARQALAAFDAAHPEVKAALKAAQAARTAEIAASSWED